MIIKIMKMNNKININIRIFKTNILISQMKIINKKKMNNKSLKRIKMKTKKKKFINLNKLKMIMNIQIIQKIKQNKHKLILNNKMNNLHK
jgi:hypothetical protein